MVTVGDSFTAQTHTLTAGRVNPRGNYTSATSSLGGISIFDAARRDGQWGTTVAALNPDCVIYQSAGNYNDPIEGITYNTAGWYTRYTTEVQSFVDTLESAGVRVALVLNPPASSEPGITVTRTLNGIHSTIAAAESLVTTIDFYEPFGGSTYVAEWRDENGHMSTAGIDLWATRVSWWVTTGAPV
jgi:hypothetical protein